MSVDTLDLGESLRANLESANVNLTDDTPLVTGTPGPARAENDNPFQQMLDNGGELPTADDAPADPEQPSSPATEAQDDPPSTAYLTRLKERFDVDYTSKYKSDDDLLQAHVNLTKKLAERDELARLGQVAATNPQGLLEYYRRHGVLPPEPQPQQPKQPEPPTPQTVSADVPEWDDEWNQYIERGRLAQDTPPATAKAIENYYRAKAIAKSPQYQAMQRKLAEIEERIGKQQPAKQEGPDPQLAEYIQMQEAEKLVSRNASWLFQDGKSHHSGFTPDGFVWVQSIQDSARRNIDPQTAIEIADLKVQNRKLASTAPKPTPNKQATQRRADPARPAQPQEQLLSGDIIRPGEDIAAAAMRLSKQLGVEGAAYWS